MTLFRLCAVMFPLLCGGLSAHPEDFDIVVYGGTSGGVTAAVQGAKMGKKVALVSPMKHLGGLSSSGLGWTDLGNIAILGGLSREFYHRVYLHYQAQPDWGSVRTMSGQGGGAFNETYQIGSVFEPKVAEAIFDAMIAENGVSVFTGLLDLDDGVVREGQRITALKMEDGRLFRGKMFIDAGYEGDVLAGAGVTFTIGREANSVHGETISGVQAPTVKHQLRDNVSPYVIAGDPASGFLPGLEPGVAANGTGDHRLQAYCFRMCLTSTAANRVMIAQPPGYDERDYELLLRNIEAGYTGPFYKLDRMPKNKTDSNNTGGVSTDHIGRNYGPDWNWATLNHAQREALANEHENWQRGLVWTLQNHPRVIAKLGAGVNTGWGLPADEFTDNNNWPYQLYVREARRMVSDYVMTQKNCSGTLKAPDSVGLAAYTMDSHHTQRYVTTTGMVKNEGDVQVGTAGPYPVSYRSIIPKVGECENLLVPWCLSSSHMAFGSIRMEPVFMTLGQSAATAAAIAINDEISVQQVPYEKLAVKLRADGQALKVGVEDGGSTGIIVDNKDPGAVATEGWRLGTASGGYGGDYLVNDAVGPASRSVRFTPDLPAAGTYQVALRWSALSNRATNVPVTITHSGGTFSTTVNQEINGGVWNTLGSFQFEAGSGGSLLIEATAPVGVNDFTIADAVQWTVPGGNSIAEVFAFHPGATRGDSRPAGFIFTRKGDITAALTVNYGIGGTAGAGEISPPLTGSVVIPAGVREAEIPLLALQAPLPLGTKTVQLTVTASASYLVGANSSATVTLTDRPFDAWRFIRFNASQLADPAVSGATADPDGNGVSNLWEFFSGSRGPAPSLLAQNDKLYLKFRQQKDAAGLRMKVWESGNLADWIPTPELFLPTLRQGNEDLRDLSIPLRTGDPHGDGRRFFELRIEE